jgi:hypothetical protein
MPMIGTWTPPTDTWTVGEPGAPPPPTLPDWPVEPEPCEEPPPLL